MNSAPSKINSAATDTSEEIRNSAECTAFRAITVKSPARIAAIEKTQKKTLSQPDKIIVDCRLPIADYSFATLLWQVNGSQIFETAQIFLLVPRPRVARTQPA